MRIDTALEFRLQKTPDHPFLEFPVCDEAFSFQKTADEAKRYAAVLSDLGFQPGDVLSTFLPNRPEMVFGFLAASYAGGVTAFPHPEYQARGLRRSFELSEPEFLLTDPDSLMVAAEAVEGLPVEVLTTDPVEGYRCLPDLAADADGDFESVSDDDTDVCVHQMTSGTTGLPKAVTQTHEAWLSSPMYLHNWLGFTTSDTLLTGFPLAHANAMYSVLAGMLAGANVVVYDQFSLSSWWDICREHDVTQFSALGSMIKQLYEQPAGDDPTTVPVRVIFSAGAEPEFIEPFEDRFDLRIVEGYGQTEACLLNLNPRDRENRKLGSVGPVPPQKKVRIVDDDLESFPRGEVGEIAVSGLGTMEEYVNQPKATAETKRDGWVLSGDYGRLDEDGYLFFVDRKKDLIRRSGENISSQEVENTIKELGEVADVAVIGVPDDVRGEEVKALVKPGTDIEPADVVDYCRDRLASFKVPRYVEHVETFPRTPTEKIQKSGLRAREREEDVTHWDRTEH